MLSIFRDYSFSQLVLFFGIYSVLGWAMETCIVSVSQKKFAQRGMLYGPLCPIYGFGALFILLFCRPVDFSAVLVFFVGMSVTTALEYLTGWALEFLFHTRWWDYSCRRFQLHGYICLRCSLFWGALSVALTFLLHRGTESLVLRLPEAAQDLAAYLFLGLLLADVVMSVLSIITLNGVLSRMNKLRASMAELSERIESALDDLKKREAEHSLKLQKIQWETLLSKKNVLHSQFLTEFPRIRSTRFDEYLNELKNARKQRKEKKHDEK